MPTSLEHSPLAELNNQFRTNKAFHAAIALFVLSAFLEAGIVLLPSAVPDISPMLSGALFVCGHCLGLVIVTVTWRPTGTIQGLWSTFFVHAQQTRKILIRMVVGRSVYGFILISVILSGPTITAAILGACPIGWSLWLRRDNKTRYQSIRPRDAGGLAAAFIGCSLVVMAQPVELRADRWLLTLGIFMALLAVLVDSQNVVSVKWGILFADKLRMSHKPSVESWGAIAGAAIGSTCAAVVFMTISLAVEGVPQQPEQAFLCVLVGAVLGSGPTIFARIAIMRTDKSTITSIALISPAISMGYLALLGLLVDLRLSYLLVGVALVVMGSAWSLRNNNTEQTIRKWSSVA